MNKKIEKEMKREFLEKWNWDRFFTKKIPEEIWKWFEEKLLQERQRTLEDTVGFTKSELRVIDEWADVVINEWGELKGKEKKLKDRIENLIKSR